MAWPPKLALEEKLYFMARLASSVFMEGPKRVGRSIFYYSTLAVAMGVLVTVLNQVVYWHIFGLGPDVGYVEKLAFMVMLVSKLRVLDTLELVKNSLSTNSSLPWPI